MGPRDSNNKGRMPKTCMIQELQSYYVCRTRGRRLCVLLMELRHILSSGSFLTRIDTCGGSTFAGLGIVDSPSNQPVAILQSLSISAQSEGVSSRLTQDILRTSRKMPGAPNSATCKFPEQRGCLPKRLYYRKFDVNVSVNVHITLQPTARSTILRSRNCLEQLTLLDTRSQPSKQST